MKYLYRVAFEFRRAGSTEQFRQHRGTFHAEWPADAKRAVSAQLEKIGCEMGGYAVYEGERLVMGAPLPIDRLRSAG